MFVRRRIAVGLDADGGVVLARPDNLLVERGAREGIVDYLRQQDLIGGLVDSVDETGPGRTTTVRLRVREPDTINQEPRWSLESAVIVRDGLRRAEFVADLNHVTLGAPSVTGNPLGAPANWAGDIPFVGRIAETKSGNRLLLSTAEPAVAPTFLRKALSIKDLKPPRVLVLDSGLRTANAAGQAPEHEELGCCKLNGDWQSSTVIGEPDDEDEPDDDRTGTLDFEAGHGTFISGIVRQICPDAEIFSAGVLSSFGDGDTRGVLESLQRVNEAAADPFDIVVMSFGAFLENDDPGLFAAELTAALGDTLAVAAAGNDMSCRPYYPAAIPGVIAVGGLAADGKAWFTNFGDWVDACAPAVDIVSTFFCDFTELIDGEAHRVYSGWARWSGTSFAAPKVAGLIAQEMYLAQVTAKEAWRRLTSHRHLRVGDLGVVFNA